MTNSIWRTRNRKMTFDVTSRNCVGGSGKPRLFAADRHLELTWLDDGSAVICNYRELTWLNCKPDNAALAWL